MLLIPPTTRFVCFDLNGTLVRDRIVHAMAFNKVLEEEGILITDAEQEKRVTNSLNKLIWPQLLQKELSDSTVQQLSTRKEKYYLELLPIYGRLTRGIFSFLEFLAAKDISAVLVTTSPSSTTHAVITLLGLENSFVKIICGDDISQGKPSPEIYNLSLLKLHASAQETIAFEDSPKGIGSAFAAGIPVIGVLPEYTQQELAPYGAKSYIQDFTSSSISY